MSFILFFSECLKLDVDSRNAIKNFALLKQEYLSSTVNVLTSSPKISNVTKRDVLQLNLTYKNKKNVENGSIFPGCP